LRSARGQSLVEFALILPLVLVLSLGVTEMGYALLDQHIVTKLTREGSNLISRDTSLQDAVTALNGMSSRPVNFAGSSKVIFSVLKNVGTVGAANYNQVILYQRHEYGSVSFSAPSALSASGGSFGGAPDYEAANSDNDTSLRVAGLPNAVAVPLGGMLYVTEIYSSHTLLTPLDQFGIALPTTLYSIAYF
jgi:hypothetical protein